MRKFFDVTEISRDDVIDALEGKITNEEALALTDGEMDNISEDMGANYIAYGFYWQDLAHFAGDLIKIKREGGIK